MHVCKTTLRLTRFTLEFYKINNTNYYYTIRLFYRNTMNTILMHAFN